MFQDKPAMAIVSVLVINLIILIVGFFAGKTISSPLVTFLLLGSSTLICMTGSSVIVYAAFLGAEQIALSRERQWKRPQLIEAASGSPLIVAAFDHTGRRLPAIMHNLADSLQVLGFQPCLMQSTSEQTLESIRQNKYADLTLGSMWVVARLIQSSEGKEHLKLFLCRSYGSEGTATAMVLLTQDIHSPATAKRGIDQLVDAVNPDFLRPRAAGMVCGG